MSGTSAGIFNIAPDLSGLFSGQSGQFARALGDIFQPNRVLAQQDMAYYYQVQQTRMIVLAVVAVALVFIYFKYRK